MDTALDEFRERPLARHGQTRHRFAVDALFRAR